MYNNVEKIILVSLLLILSTVIIKGFDSYATNTILSVRIIANTGNSPIVKSHAIAQRYYTFTYLNPLEKGLNYTPWLTWLATAPY